MVTQVQIKGFEEFAKYTDSIDIKGPPVLFYFSGEKLPNGTSWCPDCVEVLYLLFGMVGRNKPTPHVHYLNNYEEFTNFVDKLPEKGLNVYVFFTGKKKENGRSWCIYCQLAEPVVKAYLNDLQRNIIFAYVDVGDRDYWKDKNCPFRTDSRCRLMVIPTIIKWKGVQRLEGSQCNNRELLQMLFEDDD